MCGRFALGPPKDLLDNRLPDLNTVKAKRKPKYNIAPTQPTAVVTSVAPMVCEEMFWGLVPAYSPMLKPDARCINARVETVDSKPSFRGAFTHRRCVVPADHFYEWKWEGGQKWPYLIGASDGQPLLLAGLWEKKAIGNDELLTFTLLTTEANAYMKGLHDRMPIALPNKEAVDFWMGECSNERQLLDFLGHLDAVPLTHYPVSPAINDVRFDSEAAIRRMDPPASLF